MFTENLINLGNAFNQHGFQIRVVGGAVRDFLIGIDPKDIDLCTDATPDQMIQVATTAGFAYIPTGLQHGTITIIVKGEQYEVTTLRIDVATDGRHAEVEYTKSFEIDAARRDLTINAMSMDFDGIVYDYFGGREDIITNTVRFVGNPAERIQEDYLRILRFFRFAARFNAAMPEDTLSIIQDHALGLKNVSVERYWLEMSKLFAYDSARDVMKVMYKTGVMTAIGLVESQYDTTGSNPIGILSSFVKTGKVHDFNARWKISKYDTRQIEYVVKRRDNISAEQIEDDLVDGVPFAYIKTLVETYANSQYASYETWPVPVFPINGQMMQDYGFEPGVEMGKQMRIRYEIWKNSRFTMTAKQMMEYE